MASSSTHLLGFECAQLVLWATVLTAGGCTGRCDACMRGCSMQPTRTVSGSLCAGPLLPDSQSDSTTLPLRPLECYSPVDRRHCRTTSLNSIYMWITAVP